MATTWTLESKNVNAEGNQIILGVKVTTPDSGPNRAFLDTDKVAVEETNSYVSANRGLIGAITGWRMDGSDDGDAALFSSLGNASVRSAGIADVVGPKHDGASSTNVVTFTYRINLSPAGLIAINNGTTGVSIASLPGDSNGCLKLYFATGPAPVYPGASQFLSVVVNAGAVGIPPNPGSNLKLFVDAHAEKVTPTGTGHLAIWHDLSSLVSPRNLIGKPTSPSGNQPTLNWSNSQPPFVAFDDSVPQYFRSESTHPVITSPATIAAVLIPETTSSHAHIVGRWPPNVGGTSWRLLYNHGAAKLVYESAYASGTETADLLLGDATEKILAVVLRNSTNSWQGWINGVQVSNGSFTQSVRDGLSSVTVGARETIAGTADPFEGQINQTILYSTALDLFQVSLLMQQMSSRSGIPLGTPIPDAWQSQPYVDASSGPMKLDRRPIAVITLASGQWNDNIFGQSPDWRDASGNADLEALKAKVKAAFYGCDDFEIMFNRPAGQYSQDIVMSYGFGQTPDPNDPMTMLDIITPDQWDTLSTLWDYFELSFESIDTQAKNENHYPQRRAWLYIGCGLPLDDAGALDQSGYMRRRQVMAATPGLFHDTILQGWSGQAYSGKGDPRFRCMIMDYGSVVYGKFVEMVHDDQVNQNYLLIGEAIPTVDAARRGSPWFAMSGTPAGPWWKLNDEGVPSINEGYNPGWSAKWTEVPTYFGVQANAKGTLLDLYVIDNTGDVGDSNDMKMGYIFKWILKGGIPVAWNPQVYAKVGAAWNYATGRIMPSRLIRCPRLIRSIRC